jgi:hypothetical protein
MLDLNLSKVIEEEMENRKNSWEGMFHGICCILGPILEMISIPTS